jgi:hypothetical protein
MTALWPFAAPGVVVRIEKVDEHTFMCTECGQRFDKAKSAQRHIGRKHNAKAYMVSHSYSSCSLIGDMGGTPMLSSSFSSQARDRGAGATAQGSEGHIAPKSEVRACKV